MITVRKEGIIMIDSVTVIIVTDIMEGQAVITIEVEKKIKKIIRKDIVRVILTIRIKRVILHIRRD